MSSTGPDPRRTSEGEGLEGRENPTTSRPPVSETLLRARVGAGKEDPSRAEGKVPRHRKRLVSRHPGSLLTTNVQTGTLNFWINLGGVGV